MQTLFGDGDLSAYLQKRLVDAVAAVGREPAEEVKASAPVVAQNVINQWAPEPLVVDDSKPKTNSYEAQIERRDDFNGNHFKVPGLGVKATVPFTGSAALLMLQPSTSISSGRPAGDVSTDSLTIRVEAVQLSAEEARTAIRAELGRVQQYVAWANEDLEAWRPKFEQAVRTAVSERTARLRVSAGLDDLFGSGAD